MLRILGSNSQEVTGWIQLHRIELHSIRVSSVTTLSHVITTVRHIIFVGIFLLHVKNLICKKL
jgi:hypothetical protein